MDRTARAGSGSMVSHEVDRVGSADMRESSPRDVL